jgi:amino acid transporter
MEKNHHDDPHSMQYSMANHDKAPQLSADGEGAPIVVSEQNELRRDLKGRHMQMIAMSVSPDPLCYD